MLMRVPPKTLCNGHVDASNAFNSLTRQVALRNIQHLCPTLSTILTNTYQNSSLMVKPCAGTTQGNPLAMAMYVVGVMPLTSKPYRPMHGPKQTWFADDAMALAELMTFLSGIWALRSIALALGTSSARQRAGWLFRKTSLLASRGATPSDGHVRYCWRVPSDGHLRYCWRVVELHHRMDVFGTAGE